MVPKRSPGNPPCGSLPLAAYGFKNVYAMVVMLTKGRCITVTKVTDYHLYSSK